MALAEAAALGALLSPRRVEVSLSDLLHGPNLDVSQHDAPSAWLFPKRPCTKSRKHSLSVLETVVFET